LEFRGAPRKSLPQGASDVVTPLDATIRLTSRRRLYYTASLLIIISNIIGVIILFCS